MHKNEKHKMSLPLLAQFSSTLFAGVYLGDAYLGSLQSESNEDFVYLNLSPHQGTIY